MRAHGLMHEEPLGRTLEWLLALIPPDEQTECVVRRRASAPLVLTRMVSPRTRAETGDIVFQTKGDLSPNQRGATLAIARAAVEGPLAVIVTPSPRLVAARISEAFLDERDHDLMSSVAFERDRLGRIVPFCQLGQVEIAKSARVHPTAIIDRGTLHDDVTLIGDGAVIGSFVHIAHNVTVGPDAVVMDHAHISGSTTICPRAYIGAGAMISDHLRIGNDAHVGIGSVVLEDVRDDVRVMSTGRLATLRKAE